MQTPAGLYTHYTQVLLAFLVVATGCSNEKERTENTTDVDRLRSLPYVSFSPEASKPGESGTVIFDSTRTQPGLNFLTVRDLARAELVDARGELIQRWQGPPGYWARAVLLSGGDVLVVGADSVRYAMRMTWNGDVVWRRPIQTHHDIGLTPDGRVMLLTLAAARIPEISPNLPIRDDQVTILSDDGSIAESRSLYQMMRGGGFTFQAVAPDPEGFVDLFHANSARWMTHAHLYDRDPLYAAGNIIVSMRHQDTVAIFRWSGGKMLWAWGQGDVSGQHDAQVLANGNILIFDNGLSREWSRVIELDPLARRIVWEYKATPPESFYTVGRGASQRLANGNTLITESDNGRVFEVTREGDIVWQYFCPYTNSEGQRATFIRCYRVSPAALPDGARTKK